MTSLHFARYIEGMSACFRQKLAPTVEGRIFIISQEVRSV